MVGNLGQAAAAGAMALKGFLFSLSEIDFQGGDRTFGDCESFNGRLQWHDCEYEEFVVLRKEL